MHLGTKFSLRVDRLSKTVFLVHDTDLSDIVVDIDVISRSFYFISRIAASDWLIKWEHLVVCYPLPVIVRHETIHHLHILSPVVVHPDLRSIVIIPFLELCLLHNGHRYRGVGSLYVSANGCSISLSSPTCRTPHGS